MPLTSPDRQPQSPALRWFASAAAATLLASEAGSVRAALLERRHLPALWIGPPSEEQAGPRGDGCVRLQVAAHGFAGDLACALPLPLADASASVVILQHPEAAHADPGPLLEECARVLAPGGRLWLLVFNPLSPYRLRWRGHGLRAREPVSWRRRLRAAGLLPDAVARGVGPTWAIAPRTDWQDGAGLRAAFVVRSEKRRVPVTPLRVPRLLLPPVQTLA